MSPHQQARSLLDLLDGADPEVALLVQREFSSRKLAGRWVGPYVNDPPEEFGIYQESWYRTDSQGGRVADVMLTRKRGEPDDWYVGVRTDEIVQYDRRTRGPRFLSLEASDSATGRQRADAALLEMGWRLVGGHAEVELPG